MTASTRQEMPRTWSWPGFQLTVLFILTAAAQPGLAADEQYNWLQLRKLDTENRYKLRQQQRRPETGSPSSSALRPDPDPPRQNPLEPTRIRRESKMEPPGKDTFNLNQAQQLDQKQLQDRHAREQAILRQRNRTRDDTATGTRKSRAHLQRSRQQQQNQLNRMRNQSRFNRLR
jgi:hypothetical protein